MGLMAVMGNSGIRGVELLNRTEIKGDSASRTFTHTLEKGRIYLILGVVHSNVAPTISVPATITKLYEISGATSRDNDAGRTAAYRYIVTVADTDGSASIRWSQGAQYASGVYTFLKLE